MTKFKKGDYVQDLQGNVYEVVEVDSHECMMPYLLKAVKRAVAEITKTTPSEYEGYFGFAHVGDKQWVYRDDSFDEERWDIGEVLTFGDLALFDPQAVKQFKEVRYFKGDVWEDQDGNQFKVLENCTYGDASCKVDEVFMCEMMPVHINNNARTIQNTKPEDQQEAKSKLLELVKQMQTTAEPDASFKDRMKQIATKAKVQHALEAIEQAAERGEFSIFIPNGIFIREELEAYGLTVNGDVVTWA